MKPLPFLVLSALIASGVTAPAASLMLDFGATAVADPYETLSPGHSSGWIPSSETGWNTVNTSAVRNDLLMGDGTAAGVTLTVGQEATGGTNIINYSTPITNLALAGTGGGTSGQQNLLTPGSIYGDNTASTAVGRDGFFGGGTSTGTGAAIGLRIDGLAAGSYNLYVMARNTNSNAAAVPMNVFTTTGSSSGSFDFGGLTAQTQTNPVYSSAIYTDEYNTFINGDNYVLSNVTIAEGQSLFLAVDGGNDSIDRRGFLNMVQVVQVPEPSVAMLGALGLLALGIRRR